MKELLTFVRSAVFPGIVYVKISAFSPVFLLTLKVAGRKAFPLIIATYFGVTVDYLLGNEAETEQKKIASPKGSEFLEKYSHLTPQNQALIDQMLDQLSKAQSVE